MKKNPMTPKTQGLIRHILTTLGGSLMYFGVVDEATWGAISGGVLALAGVLWSYLAPEKKGAPERRPAAHALLAAALLALALPVLGGCASGGDLSGAFPRDFKGKNVRASMSSPWATLQFEAEELERVSNPELYYIPDEAEGDDDA
jgi:hypothetical protein